MAQIQSQTKQAKRAPVESPTKSKTMAKKKTVKKAKAGVKRVTKAELDPTTHLMRDITEVRVDQSGRIVLGKHLAKKLFSVSTSPDGTLTLKPAMVVPAPEAWFFEDKARVAAMERAMAQSKQGLGVETSLEELFDL